MADAPDKINPEAKPEGDAGSKTPENPQAGLQTRELPQPKELTLEQEFPAGPGAGAGETPAAREGDPPGQPASQVSSDTPLPEGFLGGKFKTLGDLENAYRSSASEITKINTRLTATEAEQARRDQMVAAYFGQEGQNLTEGQKQQLDADWVEQVNRDPRATMQSMVDKATEKAVREQVGPQLAGLQQQAGAQDVQNVIQAIDKESQDEKSPFYGFTEHQETVTGLVNNPPTQEIAEMIQSARTGAMKWRTLLLNLHNAVKAASMPELVKQQAEAMVDRERTHRNGFVEHSGQSIEQATPDSEAEAELGSMGLGMDQLQKESKDRF